MTPGGTTWRPGRVTWTSPALPWPHFFSDLSGLGGSAAVSGDSDVVVAACPHLAASAGLCADPELVAFTPVSRLGQGESKAPATG